MLEAPHHAPLLLPFGGVEPRFGEGVRFLAPGASVLGKVETGANAMIAGGAVIRGDGHFVRIGGDFFIGETSTVHIAQDLYPTIIGDRVTVGRNAVVHACTVGSDCVIGDNAVILDGSVLEDGALIEADSTVFPKSKLAGGFILCGHSGETRARADPGGTRGPRPRLAASPGQRVCRTEGRDDPCA